MFVLVAVGTSAAFGYSLLSMLLAVISPDFNEGSVYFDASALIITFICGGVCGSWTSWAQETALTTSVLGSQQCCNFEIDQVSSLQITHSLLQHLKPCRANILGKTWLKLGKNIGTRVKIKVCLVEESPKTLLEVFENGLKSSFSSQMICVKSIFAKSNKISSSWLQKLNITCTCKFLT